jgi:hypothetical protein
VSETCFGIRVHLVGVSISFKKNFYRLPFTPPPSGRQFGPSQDTSHAPQAKEKVVLVKSNKKPKPYASQDNFYADYVLTWDHKGKVVAKCVGHQNIDQKECVGAQGSYD